MASPNKDAGKNKPRRSPFLPNPSTLTSARRPTTRRLTSLITPTQTVPGNSAFPPPQTAPSQPAREVPFASFTTHQLLGQIMSSSGDSSHIVGRSPGSSGDEATAPDAADDFDHTVGEQQEEQLYDSDNGEEEEDDQPAKKKAKVSSKPKQTAAAAKKAGKRVAARKAPASSSSLASRKVPSSGPQGSDMNVGPQPIQSPKKDRGRKLPKTRAQADAADTMLMEWKESGQKSWDAIDRRWCEMTGDKPGEAVLPARYWELKQRFANNEGTINSKSLERAKAMAEEKLETIRWSFVSQFYDDLERVKVKGQRLRSKWYELQGEEEPEAPDFEEDEEDDDEDDDDDDDEDDSDDE